MNLNLFNNHCGQCWFFAQKPQRIDIDQLRPLQKLRNQSRLGEWIRATLLQYFVNRYGRGHTTGTKPTDFGFDLPPFVGKPLVGHLIHQTDIIALILQP